MGWMLEDGRCGVGGWWWMVEAGGGWWRSLQGGSSFILSLQESVPFPRRLHTYLASAGNSCCLSINGNVKNNGRIGHVVYKVVLISVCVHRIAGIRLKLNFKKRNYRKVRALYCYRKR